MTRIETRLTSQWIADRDLENPNIAPELVDLILLTAREASASDIHLQPLKDAWDLSYRIDGVLRGAGPIPKSLGTVLVARMKVLASLLTYRTDIPQEGRMPVEKAGGEMRLSTFPTLYGERAVVRLFSRNGQYERLDDLNMPSDVVDELGRLLQETSGAVLFVGPAGSGKTTSAYACMRCLAGPNVLGDEGEYSSVRRSLVSIEDPIEAEIEGVAQSQVDSRVDLSLSTGLRFLMRQDPEAILVGEIRDRETAEAAMQASLTGHLLLSTFHAGSAAEAISRLSELGVEPFLLRSGLLAIVCQRLVRQLCSCAEPDESESFLNIDGPILRPVGCDKCRGTGYDGRRPIVELLTVQRTNLGRAILSRRESDVLEGLAVEQGMISRWTRARDAVKDGTTDPMEIVRVFGPRVHEMGLS